MNKAVLQERKRRAEEMLRIFSEMYPGKQKSVLEYSNPLEMLIAVILSAQCTDEQVNKVTKKLFKKYKTVHDYATVTQITFEKDIFSTGFYKNKAKNIIAMAQMLEQEYGGIVPKTMTELIRLPGVGRKTANVVLGNVYGIVEGIAVDTHVRRFVRKMELTDSANPIIIERDLMEILPRDIWSKFTYYCIRYGRDICPARKHDCAGHPLSLIYPPAAHIWPTSK